jgi:predicted nuclease of predicted toxin-antitoxin system
MKFIGDIPIARATLERLSLAGHDAISVRDRLSPKASDPEILRLAAMEGRVVICFDLGLADLVALSRQPLPSVITFRTSRHRADYMTRRQESVLPDIADDLKRGALVTIEDARVRVRPLPVQMKD